MMFFVVVMPVVDVDILVAMFVIERIVIFAVIVNVMMLQ